MNHVAQKELGEIKMTLKETQMIFEYNSIRNQSRFVTRPQISKNYEKYINE